MEPVGRVLHFLEAAREAWGNTGAVFPNALGEWAHPSTMNEALNSLLAWSDPEAFEKRLRHTTAQAEVRDRLWAAVLAGSRLPELCVHDLRHTYATLALRKGVPAEVVSKVLGHARVSVTMDIYRHVLDSERRQAAIDLFASPHPGARL